MSKGAEARIRRSREKILVAAEDAFLLHGYLGTSMDVVAKQAGVSKQTVYVHFGSKEALFVAVVEGMTGAAAHQIGEDAEDDFTGVTVRDFLLGVAQDQLSVVLTPRLMRLRRMVIGEVERFPELGRSLYENGPQRSIARVATALAHFMQQGQLRRADPKAAAAHFNWLVMGGPLNAAMLLGDEATPSGAALDLHARESVRIFLAAFGPVAAGHEHPE